MFGESMIFKKKFFKEMNLIQQWGIKLSKSDNKYIYNITKDLYFYFYSSENPENNASQLA